ncbi:tRNA (adenosine(37)-N6)-dimethylallyltransferase MiaA [Pedobacter yonginense]|uniref:tRNA dimethylallyltransferase n=1 Tax=Pedobacter yonginense TaxID=651869 RepID=A0A317EUQ5_9SPHI|nr:tRNA (adenosine(37)-N6)-dimethylallyltransferase MiaA [Pedobacter yonginense]PWS28898.1 tRNA (adenosine(37)-N6)-dimethylallyltransferase MiaA [Pedobacter yonginense]
MAEHNLIVILGATASGKTKLAVSVAKELHTEIISGDSRQIFKRMDIGTGKDLSEYNIGGEDIPYHLIDILEPGERYHVDAFKNDFFNAFEAIRAKGKVPILCGGTGMYIHSILQNQPYTAVPKNESLRNELDLISKEDLLLQLKSANTAVDLTKVDISSKKRIIRALEVVAYLKHHTLKEVERPPLKPLVFGLRNEIDVTTAKISSRLDKRFEEGMIQEVEKLLEEGVAAEALIYYGLEYKFIVNYLHGNLTFAELKVRLATAICQYAKRQNTFFRKMEKDGITINWLDASTTNNLLKQAIIQKVLAK